MSEIHNRQFSDDTLFAIVTPPYSMDKADAVLLKLA